MSFAAAQPVPRYPVEDPEVAVEIINGEDGWPDLDPNIARAVIRLNGTVTNTRLIESLNNSIQAIQSELAEWMDKQVEPLTPRQRGLYLRAVYFTTKADLNEQYRDFDATKAGLKEADQLEEGVNDARKTVRWAISDLMGLSRVTVEAL